YRNRAASSISPVAYLSVLHSQSLRQQIADNSHFISRIEMKNCCLTPDKVAG
ncbi:hypothetical protein AVEN_242357-1, partial [Araneus ventricosus]